MTDVNTKRLDRIEAKLDKLTEVVATIARLDERIVTLYNRIERHEFRLDDQEKKTEDLTEAVTNNSTQIKNSERLFWIAVSALASYVVYIMKV